MKKQLQLAIQTLSVSSFWIALFWKEHSLVLQLLYTGGILQQLDTNVHNAVTAKTGTAL